MNAGWCLLGARAAGVAVTRSLPTLLAATVARACALVVVGIAAVGCSLAAPRLLERDARFVTQGLVVRGSTGVAHLELALEHVEHCLATLFPVLLEDPTRLGDLAAFAMSSLLIPSRRLLALSSGLLATKHLAAISGDAEFGRSALDQAVFAETTELSTDGADGDTQLAGQGTDVTLAAVDGLQCVMLPLSELLVHNETPSAIRQIVNARVNSAHQMKPTAPSAPKLAVAQRAEEEANIEKSKSQRVSLKRWVNSLKIIFE